jgi:hypothetical protein
MDVTNFTNTWKHRGSALHHFFSDDPPLGWRMRTAHESRWLRFYGLPGGELPNGEDAKIAQILDRFVRLSQALYSDLDALVCIISPVRKYEGREYQYRGAVVEDHGLRPIQLGLIDEADERGFTFDLYGTTMRLSDPSIAAIVSDIAKDRIMQSIICSDAGELISPYESGFDVITQDLSKLTKLKAEFSEWQSTEPTGL